MFRAALIIISVLFISGSAFSAEKNYRYIIQQEYRTDSIDYDGFDKTFTRERVKVSLSPETFFNYTHVNMNLTENRITWNFVSSDAVPFMKLIAGNFSVNFGGGLLSGRRVYIPDDPYQTKIYFSFSKTFIPDVSGNPAFSFNGIGLSGFLTWKDFRFSAHTFYSIRPRYISDDPYISPSTDSTIKSTALKLNYDHNNQFPVIINDTGAMIELKYLNFSSQFYFIYSDIKSGEDFILWDYNINPFRTGGVKHYLGYGTFSKYEDDYLVLFGEASGTSRCFSSNGSDSEWVNGFGAQFGIIYKHPVFRIKIAGKFSGEDFYAPYGSTGTGSESRWHAGADFKINRNLSTGISVEASKNLSPSSFYSILYSSQRMEFFVKYNFLNRFIIQGAVNFISRDAEYGTNESKQFKFKIKNYLNKNFKAEISAVYQNSSGMESFGAGIGSGLRISFFNADINYSFYNITGDNYIYSIIDPMPYSVSSGSFIRSGISVLTAKILLKFDKGSFIIRYQTQFDYSSVLSNRLEIIGRINI